MRKSYTRKEPFPHVKLAYVVCFKENFPCLGDGPLHYRRDLGQKAAGERHAVW
jgi:hypothetical protein